LDITNERPDNHMAASGSTKVVIAALGANAMIAIAKFVAAGWTGSAAMLAEAIHSLADTANQGLLLLGLKRSARPADQAHPFGHARELYFWAFVVAVLLFSLGAGVAIYEGVSKLRDPHPIAHAYINYIVLGVAIFFEGISTVVATREFNARRNGQGVITALRSSKDPALFTVLLEDVAALTGLLVALAGVAAADQLGWTIADAIASIIIGLILGFVAAFMSIETKSLIVGEAALPETVDGIRRIIGSELRAKGAVAGLHELRTMQLGPNEILVAASFDFKDGESAKSVKETIDRLDTTIKSKFPDVRHLFLEVQAASKGPASSLSPLAGPREDAASDGDGDHEAGNAAAQEIIALFDDEAPKPAHHAAARPRGNYPPAKKGKGKRRRR
jgi:cation diffusion facilitator family transporter